MKKNILIVFVLLIIAILLNNCSNNKSEYQLYLKSYKNATYEAGEPVYVYILPFKETSIKNPINITAKLNKPDGSIIQSNVLMRDHTYPCDIFLPELQWVCEAIGGVAFDDVLDEEGIYKITASADDNTIKIKDYSFKVTSLRINSLFIDKETGGYKLKTKYKSAQQLEIPYDLFTAIYYSNKSKEDYPEQKKEIVVILGLTSSRKDADYYSGINYPWKQTGQIVDELGSEIFLIIEPKNNFIVGWPSDKTVVTIEGFQKYQDSEKQFVREYLKKYPSTLKSNNN